MDLQTIFAGATGAGLTFAGQHFLGILQSRRLERDRIIAGRAAARERIVQLTNSLGQDTGDYIEASCRMAVDIETWGAMKSSLIGVWREFTDARVLLPRLGDVQLVNSALLAHTFFAMRINCFYNEHPAATVMYLNILREEHPDLRSEDFRWTLDVLAINRKMHWRITDELAAHHLRLGLSDVASSWRVLRAQAPVQESIVDHADLYRPEYWPKGHYLVWVRLF